MPRTRKTSAPDDEAAQGTRQALLRAAAEQFAENGYEATRVRDIAMQAGANLAAINYHFGGKQALYLEVLREQAGERIARFPLPGASQFDSDEAELKATVMAILGRFLAEDRRAIIPKLLMREFVAPTPALQVMVRDVAEPQFRQLRAIVARLLGPQAGESLINHGTFSILGQCMFYLFARPLVSALVPQTYSGDVIAQLCAQISQFSLAALQGLRVRGLPHA